MGKNKNKNKTKKDKIEKEESKEEVASKSSDHVEDSADK